MSEVVEHEYFYAAKDFLTPQECQDVVKFMNKEASTLDCLKRIVDVVEQWNNKTLRFNIDPTQPRVVNFTGEEAQVRSTTTPDHAIHIGNVANPTPIKWSVILNLHNRDDVQGGELMFRNWAQTPYKDNFGNWKGDPNKPHMPAWINEMGSIVIYPAMVEQGYQLVTSGTATRAKVFISGPQFA